MPNTHLERNQLSLRNVALPRLNPITAAFFAAILMFLLWLSRFFLGNVDEGMILSSAMKVAQGQLMYRDFFEFWVPGTVYVMGALYYLFGVHIWVSQLMFVVLSLATYISSYLLARLLGFPTYARLILILIVIFCTIPILGVSHHWFGLLGLIISALWITKYAQTKQTRFALIAALSVGITLVFMQLEGVAALLACLAVAFIYTERHQRLGLFVRMLAISASPLLIITLAISLQGGLEPMLYDVIWFPITQYNRVNTPFSLIWCTEMMLWAAFFFLYRYYRWWDTRSTVLLTFSLAVALVNINIGGNMTIYLSVFLVMLFADLFTRFKLSALRRLIPKPSQLNQFLENSSPARFVPVFALIFLSPLFILTTLSIQVPYWVNIMATPKTTIVTPAGPITTSNRSAHEMTAIFEFLAAHTSMPQPIYFGPYSGYYNVLTQRPNPISYSQLTPAYNPPWMFDQAVEQLKQSNAQFIIFLPRESPFRFEKDNTLYQYLEQNFRRVVTFPDPEYATQLGDLSNIPQDGIWQRTNTSGASVK
jgi:hypothetical protein